MQSGKQPSFGDNLAIMVSKVSTFLILAFVMMTQHPVGAQNAENQASRDQHAIQPSIHEGAIKDERGKSWKYADLIFEHTDIAYLSPTANPFTECRDRLLRYWLPPPSPPPHTYSVTVIWDASKSGEVTNIRLARTSGIAALDNAVIKAVRDASPLPVWGGFVTFEHRVFDADVLPGGRQLIEIPPAG